jgi:hypothetical protein
MDWVEQPTVTYVFTSSEFVKLDSDTEARRVRGRCLGFARRLDDGSWETKLSGPKHTPQAAVSRADAHRMLKQLVYGTKPSRGVK